MVDGLHPAIRVVAGNERVRRDFDHLINLPALFVFDRRGREVYRLGVARGPGAKRHIRREDIARIVSELE